MNDYMNDKVIVITGAGGGFGRLIALKAAALGAKVVGADINTEALTETIEQVTSANGQGLAVPTDVTDAEQFKSLVKQAAAAFGRVDVLVNNAGILPLAFFADHEEALGAWHRAIDINFKGTLNGITAVYDQMIGQGQGHVVNISSTYSSNGTEGSGVYSGTKQAINALSESLRTEAQGKIKVSVVKPTGVSATGLSQSILNPQASFGMFGHHLNDYLDNRQRVADGTLPQAYADPESIEYWSLEPEYVADSVLHVINQPWGVLISDITVRASGEQFIF